MGKGKLLAEVRDNPRNIKFSDFCKAMESVGFVLDRQKGSHRVYKHPEAMETMVVQPRKDGHAKSYQVRQFLDVVEKYRMGDTGHEDPKA